jgi:hypothetical protein
MTEILTGETKTFAGPGGNGCPPGALMLTDVTKKRFPGATMLRIQGYTYTN